MTGGGKKFMIVDGNSLIHRAFHALPLLSNRQGVFTNAVYGFTNMLMKILAEEKPDLVAVAFDKGRVTFRNEQYEAYKGHRKATPEELRPQFPLIKRILRAMKIETLEVEGFEADDIIGTMARRAEAAGLETVVLTGDRDALQLVSPLTRVLLTKKGISDMLSMGMHEVREQFGLEPDQLRDVKGLMGDTSDNIPGVPGVGEKTAVKLIQEYRSLENLLENVDRVARPKLAADLKQWADQAKLSKSLATICRDAPVEVEPQECRFGTPNYPELLEIFKELDFQSLVKVVLGEMQKGRTEAEEDDNQGIPGNFKVISTEAEVRELLAAVRAAGRLAISLKLSQPDYLGAEIQAVGISCNEGAGYGIIPASLHGRSELFYGLLAPLLGDPAIDLLVHDAKEAVIALRKRGIEVEAGLTDTMLAAYLLNPSAPGHQLPEVCLEHLDQALVPEEDPGLEVAVRSAAVFRLAEVLPPKLAVAEMVELYREVELPLVRVLAGMEWAGVTVDREQLEAMGRELGEGITRLTEEIYGLAGEEFNLNSPKQLGVILFERLGLPASKKTKTGYSTSAEVLEELAPKHEVVARILEYRMLMKLKSTYVDGLRPLIDPRTHKVHTTFNQMVTATGRLSSTEPNMQNIPVRLELGRRLRKVFVPSGPDRLLLAADYSQIELRVLAHISGDPNLIEAFIEEQDIHTRTASEVFGVPMEQVTPEMRRRAKAVNFGIVYGISDFGLARDLGISRGEARQYIEQYLARYPGVRRYLHDVVQEAKGTGYVTTLLKRRRYLPDLFSSNFSIRNFGERTAMNTPIQGSAADIIKLAMLGINAGLKERGWQAEMILQVHDELIFDVPNKELPEVAILVREYMENAVSLRVPLKVELKQGQNWYEMTAYDPK